jgi:hypothetical protein
LARITDEKILKHILQYKPKEHPGQGRLFGRKGIALIVYTIKRRRRRNLQ